MRRTSIAFVLALLVALPAAAQTADDIIAKSIAAKGGLAKLQAVKTVRMTGRMTVGPGIDAPIVLDIRFDKEWKRGHIPGATHMENGRLAWEDLPFPPEGAIAVTCATGGRSMTGISVLARRGYRHLYQVQGGFTAWAESGLPVERS